MTSFAYLNQTHMQQTISSGSFENILIPTAYLEKQSRINSLRKFINWCDQQEKNRLLWLGLGIMGHIGMVLPLTLLAILFLANNNFALWVVVLCANMPVLAFNLAAQPPKITIPVMLTSLIINIVVILLSAVMFLI
jgi:K+-sensing histidine kinase KdpD